MLDDDLVTEYLTRIAAGTTAIEPGLPALKDLQARHLRSVPFENLSYHLGEEIHMDERATDKIVHDRRGGGCYEVNPSLGFLLEAVGFEVSIMPGRVWIKGVLGPPLCHLVLKVRAEDATWLVDVGFGRNSLYPLSLETADAQEDPHGTYRIRRADDDGLDVLLGDQPLYRVYDVDCHIADFGPTLWWYRTAPDSPFLQNLFCSMPTPDGRVTLKEDVLSIVSGGTKETMRLESEEEILAAYDKWFGVSLDVPPVKVGTNPGVSMSFD